MICTYNARMLTSDASVEDLMMREGTARYTRCSTLEKNCSSEHAIAEALVVSVSSSTRRLVMNIDPFEQLTTRIGRLRRMRSGSMPALMDLVVYTQTSDYIIRLQLHLELLVEEVEAF
ncbi:unnamed protein product [Nippostrongylus brasiliensis]|uniref:Uncharacterized protein n=1 Tax=Nippostrongylus brasiliensis TaxID=27835 RepID=A0A0N4YHT9_NIPBR|nr:unnamed protein product [Nippostrongylus brasiliensis]